MVPFIQPTVAMGPVQPLDPDPHADMHCQTWVPGDPVANTQRTVLIGGMGMFNPMSDTVNVWATFLGSHPLTVCIFVDDSAPLTPDITDTVPPDVPCTRP